MVRGRTLTCPVKRACTCEPVRISPGTTLVTVTGPRPSSARSPSEKPTAANLAVLYGRRCGTLGLPPIEATVTIRPCCWRRMTGRASKAKRAGASAIVSSAILNSSGGASCTGPTWMIPALLRTVSSRKLFRLEVDYRGRAGRRLPRFANGTGEADAGTDVAGQSGRAACTPSARPRRSGSRARGRRCSATRRCTGRSRAGRRSSCESRRRSSARSRSRPHGYEIFRDKADGCIKVVLHP